MREEIGIFPLHAENHPRLRLENNLRHVVVPSFELRKALMGEDQPQAKVTEFR